MEVRLWRVEPRFRRHVRAVWQVKSWDEYEDVRDTAANYRTQVRKYRKDRKERRELAQARKVVKA